MISVKDPIKSSVLSCSCMKCLTGWLIVDWQENKWRTSKETNNTEQAIEQTDTEQASKQTHKQNKQGSKPASTNTNQTSK